MHGSVKLATLVALLVSFGNSLAWAQQGSTNNPGQAQTDPIGKPAGDPTTNSLVPFGVNPPVPDASTPIATDSVRPPTTPEKVPVPQGNFASESANPAVGRTPGGTSTGIGK
jgi:hypothetical protein